MPRGRALKKRMRVESAIEQAAQAIGIPSGIQRSLGRNKRLQLGRFTTPRGKRVTGARISGRF